MEALQKLEKVDGRVNNGSSPGSNRGGGRRPSIEKLKAKAYSIATAEFWADLAQDKGIQRLLAILNFETDKPNDTQLRAVQEVLNRALGKPKESHEFTCKDGGEILLRWLDKRD
jgi:hypothetical protein